VIGHTSNFPVGGQPEEEGGKKKPTPPEGGRGCSNLRRDRPS